MGTFAAVSMTACLAQGIAGPTSVNDIHEGDRENIGLLATAKVGNVGIEGNTLR